MNDGLTRSASGVRRLPRLSRVATVQIVHRSDSTGRSSIRGRRARAAVVAGIALFVLGQASLNLAIRTDVLPVRDPVWSEKFELLQARPAFFVAPAPSDSSVSPVRLLALGSSRTQLAFDATALATTVSEHLGRPVEAFNFGCPAAGAMTCSLYFRRLLEEGVRPDYVLVEIHPGFVTPGDPPFESRWLHPYRFRTDEVELLRSLGWNVPTPPHHGWQGWLSASASYRMSLLNRYAPVLLPCPYGLTLGSKTNPDGFVAGQEMPRDRYPKALARTKLDYSPILTDYHTGGPGAAAVRDVLEQCRDHGIRAAILLTPESSEHREWYGDAGNLRLLEFAQGLAAEFGVPLVNARDWVPDTGIADGHHLTQSGATIFTDRLATEFIEPWLAQPGEVR